MGPAEVTFRHMPHSGAIESVIRERVEKLETYFPSMISCRILVEVSHRRRATGHVYHVRALARVPGAELFADAEPPPQHQHEDVYIAIRDAFDALRRELEDHARMQRGDKKTRAAAERGRVLRIFHDRGYGFLETPEGGEIYFHKNSVLDGFEHLSIGTEVRFTEEDGDSGPQASTVSIAGRAQAALSEEPVKERTADVPVQRRARAAR